MWTLQSRFLWKLGCFLAGIWQQAVSKTVTALLYLVKVGKTEATWYPLSHFLKKMAEIPQDRQSSQDLCLFTWDVIILGPCLTFKLKKKMKEAYIDTCNFLKNCSCQSLEPQVSFIFHENSPSATKWILLYKEESGKFKLDEISPGIHTPSRQ